MRLPSRFFLLFSALTLTFLHGARADERELLRDPRFRNGFMLLKSEPGRRAPLSALQRGSTPAPPAWELAQWSSRFAEFQRPPVELPGGGLRWENPGKAVTLAGAHEGGPDLSLEINGGKEYNGALRREGEPWVHLLAEQTIADAPSVADLHHLNLEITVRLKASSRPDLPGYNPGLHAAQFLLFLHIQNMNRQSAGYGQYLHFGAPIYDDRHRQPPAHVAPDTGGTGMFIYMPAAAEFTDASVQGGEWVAIRRDALPMIRKGLETAWSRDCLTASRDLRDYRVTFLTLGWELPGANDAEMEIRDLSLRADSAN